MKLAVIGASGNVGTAVLRRLGPEAHEIHAVARRTPDPAAPAYQGVQWFSTDISDPGSTSVLRAAMRGCDAVVHAAWALMPNRDPGMLHRVNVVGTRRVVDAAVAEGVSQLVYLSSLGAYSPGKPADIERRIAEQWPTGGIPTSVYSRDKVAVERYLDTVEERHPDLVLTRLRPTLILQDDAASEIARYFLGALRSPRLLRAARGARVILPLPEGLVLQFVHADDVADAVARALLTGSGGAFNLVAEPALGPDQIAAALGLRRVPVPAGVLRAAVALGYRLRVLPTEAGWLDMGMQTPLMSSDRAARILGWVPRHDPRRTLIALAEAMAAGTGGDSAVLAPAGRVPR